MLSPVLHNRVNSVRVARLSGALTATQHCRVPHSELVLYVKSLQLKSYLFKY
jgi:hypothetical protein